MITITCMQVSIKDNENFQLIYMITDEFGIGNFQCTSNGDLFKYLEGI